MKLAKNNNAPHVYWKHGTTQTSAQNTFNQWKVITSGDKNDAPIYNHLDYVRQAIGRSLLLRPIKEAHQKQPNTDKNTSSITMGEKYFTAAEGQHSSSEDTDMHSTSPRRLSDMSDLSDQRDSTNEAAYSSGANDSEPEYGRNSDEDDRQYESDSDDSVV